MSYGPNASQEYLKNAVMTASPEQLQLMLYDGAIRFATRGLDAMRAGNREGTFLALERAQRIVLELGNGLRREINPELVDRMASLYNFIYRRLIEANLDQDEEALNDAIRVLNYQRESWLLLMEQLQKDEAAPSPPTGLNSAQATPPGAGQDDESPSFDAQG